ncbi:calmodulin-beta-like [Dendronephthya gigantea]|uniref:calmodulin-beta-like n=1 Tax=Dendronephthya gigantea TaxID=151771 RepID=UPI0010692435|nr:calmodulin-beta-like [Dendronephthya gigantea]
MATSRKEYSKGVQDAFDLFDKNGDGTISVKELREAMQQAGHNAAEEMVEKMLKSHDKDENGVLTIDEFEKFLRKDNQENHAELKEAFELFDTNGNGYISKEELVQAMKRLGEDLSNEELESMIRNADINKDGQVSFEEFKRMMAPK